LNPPSDSRSRFGGDVRRHAAACDAACRMSGAFGSRLFRPPSSPSGGVGSGGVVLQGRQSGATPSGVGRERACPSGRNCSPAVGQHFGAVGIRTVGWFSELAPGAALRWGDCAGASALGGSNRSAWLHDALFGVRRAAERASRLDVDDVLGHKPREHRARHHWQRWWMSNGLFVGSRP